MIRLLQPNEFQIEIDGQPGAAVLRWPDHIDIAGEILAGRLTVTRAAEIVDARDSLQTMKGSDDGL
jgi:hypothetical protein